jgi:uncharacterized membrane protein
MSVKQTYLSQLRTELRKYPSGAVDDYIEYYDELISERIADGENETLVLRRIGTPKEIANSFKQDNAINRAVKKPTVSNGLKALLAVLGVLSLPLLIPVLAVIVIACLVCGVFILVGLVALVCGVVAAVAASVDITGVVIARDAPFYLIPLVYGCALIAIFVAFELFRGLMILVRKITRTLVHRLQTRRVKRKQQNAKEER